LKKLSELLKWFYLSFFRKIYKITVHFLSGKPEIYRICADKIAKPEEMATGVAISLIFSKQLGEISICVFGDTPVDSEVMADRVLSIKGLKSVEPRVRTALKKSFDCIGLVNALISEVSRQRKEAYDSSNASHELLLETLWSEMRPGVRRKGGRITDEWGEIGFQGKDPATDFRGMGILALEHLVHFAKVRPADAHKILTECSHEVRYYPFAATGINMTGYVCSLLERRLLDPSLYGVASSYMGVSYSALDTELQSGNDLALQKMQAFIADTYADLYTEFHQLWMVSNPQNTLCFPRVFRDFKNRVEERLLRTWYGNEPKRILSRNRNCKQT